MLKVLYVGVDVAKKSLAVAVWGASGGTTLEVVANEPAGFEALARQVEAARQREQAEAVHLIIEPTAGYELRLVYDVYGRGWQVSIVHPLTVRDWMKGLGQRAKTDRIDALLLARYGVERQPRCWQPLPEVIIGLESLLSRKNDLEHLLRQERNRLEIATIRPTTAAAVLHNIQMVIAALEVGQAEVEQALEQLLNQQPELEEQAERLDELPGVGEKIVLPLLVKLQQWQSMTDGQGNGKGLTALVGLDPQTCESGSSVRKRATISRKGDPNLRRLLFMGALGAIRGDNPLRQFYRSLVGRGKPKMVALIACAHKILLWAWAIFRSGEHFDPARHAKQPSALPQTA
jgi:transposase